MTAFIQESPAPQSRWTRALGLLHAIGCAAGFTFCLV